MTRPRLFLTHGYFLIASQIDSSISVKTYSSITCDYDHHMMLLSMTVARATQAASRSEMDRMQQHNILMTTNSCNVHLRSQTQLRGTATKSQSLLSVQTSHLAHLLLYVYNVPAQQVVLVCPSSWNGLIIHHISTLTHPFVSRTGTLSKVDSQ